MFCISSRSDRAFNAGQKVGSYSQSLESAQLTIHGRPSDRVQLEQLDQVNLLYEVMLFDRKEGKHLQKLCQRLMKAEIR